MSVFDSFAVDTLSYANANTLDATIDLLAEHGCRAVQLSLHPGYLWPSELDAGARRLLDRRLRERSIRAVSVNLPGVEVNITSPAAEMRAYSLDLLRQNIDLAADLGAPAMVIAPGRQHPLMPLPRDMLMTFFHAALDHLCTAASRRGTTVCVENAPSSFLPDVNNLMAGIEEHGGAQLGVCYDLPNAHFIKEDMREALRRIGGRLRLLHVADTSQAAHRHAAIGEGTICFADIHPVLSEIGYGGPSVIEVISPKGHPDMEASASALAVAGWGTGRDSSQTSDPPFSQAGS